ncbi:hypothetical protein H1D32_03235 [Anaerobacillus sp. CMMVII]|uniref:hypothetical protein n=1 Tax=Anaerobacillus sp. CMMVII TaxID=2755588 RepID=UPI0021B828D2|nr:hypothetical protein [Anaerobacillus sp. CMMVII]MCT8136854.1 hypothetical protein [Anaerobacillus sp. CMMVII]
MAKKRNNQDWVEAKKICRLNDSDIQMAKELGMKPKSLIKNIPVPNEQWKAPVKLWVRELYEEKFGRILTATSSLNKEKNKNEEFYDKELPF